MIFKFATTCVQLPLEAAEELRKMDQRARQITYKTICRHLGTEELASQFPQYVWGRGKKTGVRMKHDPYVQYYKSYFRGQRCLGVDWSAIDHIWVAGAA